jgi:2-oxoglutarate dehydrogenase complex dehydrogenase (E1) component-like enzyme
MNAQAEAHKVEVEGLKKKLAEMNEDFEVVKAKKEISETETARVQKNIQELWDSREKCYELSIVTEPPKVLGPLTDVLVLRTSDNHVGAHNHSTSSVICIFI